MTNERRQDVVLGALIFSIVLHVGLMIYMRPQIMAHVTPGVATQRSRGPMTVADAVDAPEPVALEVVTDVEAVRESPVAEADEIAPAALALSDLDPADVQAPVPIEPDVSDIPKPEVEIAPFLSEKIHVEGVTSSFSTPIAENGGFSAPRAPVVAPAAEPGPIAPEVELPMFTAPTIRPEAVAELPVSLPDEEKPAKKTAGGEDASFTPGDDVLPTVDVKVVEAEKTAVRELLDVKDAEEIAKVVSLQTTSAQAGDWLYFRVRFAPEEELEVVPKDIVLLMDASGSIGKDRITSIRNATQKILRSCTNSGDRFNLVAFRNKFSYAFTSWQECNKDSFDRADAWLQKLVAHGRTDVFSVVRSVLTLPRDPSRPLIALVVTDGDANAGVSETSQILSRFTHLNDGLISVYMYGVKGTANRELIDVLTHGNRGESFIFDGNRWQAGEGIEGLSNRFRDPVLTDLRVVFATGVEAETYPRLLKNLYKGETVDFVGRVPKGQGEVAFSIKGLNGSKPYESFFRLNLAKAGFDETLPTTWQSERVIDEKLR